MRDPRTGKPIASLSLDLDNLWSYMKTHGDAGWESRPTYLPRVVPVALDLLREHDYAITFFVVGVDADRDENVDALRSIVGAGHEIGNHSYEHEPWLSRYSPGQLTEEIARAEVAIERAVGTRPLAFRGPGYSWSGTLLDILAGRGYLLDASTLPTWLGPLARRYYFATAKLTAKEREERASLFGTWGAGAWPNTPYLWSVGTRSLLEIPVTVMPWARTPFHPSYLLYLARFSEPLALAYWRAGLLACRAAGVNPSILLHPLDVVSADVAPELRFFPGMDVPTSTKHRVLRKAFALLSRYFHVVPMSGHAQRLLGGPALPRRAVPGSLAAAAGEG